MVLPSNSSMMFYPNNTTTHFNTKLSHPLELIGNWSVSLEEIQYPMTFYNIPVNEQDDSLYDGYRIPYGVYKTVQDICNALNQTPTFKDHFFINIVTGGFIEISRICADGKCSTLESNHSIKLMPSLHKIFGMAPELSTLNFNKKNKYKGIFPASISASIPDTMFIYTDICDCYVTGDVQTQLLRVVPINSDKNSYGTRKIKCFSPQRYIPIQHSYIESIEIDIRDEYGNPIPFVGGTLTVTLHFKRNHY